MDDSFRIRKGLYLLFLLSLSGVVCVSIRYSLPEEKKSGSLVANVLKDLKLGPGELSARRAQLVSKSKKQYFQLDTHSGNLFVNEKIDREALCGKMEPCLLLSEIVLQDPLKIYNTEIEIKDVNDNSPKFSKKEFELAIPEHVPTNTRFPLESAQDTDLGENSIQNYTLSVNGNFKLDVQSNEFGSKYVDLVLEKPLDREKEAQFQLTLTAVDGGMPQRTGTIQIKINVLDNNDNFPQFTQSEYKVKLKENSPRGTLVSKVEARDLDFGSNAEITYSFHRVPENIEYLFYLHQTTGEITVLGLIDYEKEASYHFDIKATDGGGLSGHCKVLVEIEDENDNVPEISVISVTNPLAEDSLLDTQVVLFSVTDQDSGDNGRTSCSVEMNLPFLLKSTVNNYYQLVTQRPLDREKVPEYNITISATDRGSPKLISVRIISVEISDVNDNSPVFEKSKYEMQVWENNIPGLLMGSVHAVDLDVEQNAKVTYSLVLGNASGAPAASYISINSETGNLYVLRSLDYEQIKEFQVRVRASDGGSPSLSSEVVVQVVILDENDNAPFFLYPFQNSTSPFNELVPKSVEAGYLVAKVVAVDGDSGQNSWLSYELIKATDPSLFSIGAQNGEVKTRRPLTERDTNKQRLIILVRDNGHPPQTSTATLNILPVDGFSDPYLNIASVSHEASEEDGSLTMYLVICLSAVSFVFLICIIVFVAIKVLKKESSFITALPQFPPALPDIPETGVDSQSGSLSRAYQYDVCLTGGSLSSDFRFLRPFIPVFSVGDPSAFENHRISSVSQETPEQAEGQEQREQHLISQVLFPTRKRETQISAVQSHKLVPEEKKSGSLVANVLKDLKVDVKGLSARGARLVSKSSKQFFQLDPHSGNLLLKDRIDREGFCGQKDPCVLISEIVLENPLQVHRIEVQIEDVNDNSPHFSKKEFRLEIPEQTPLNTRFPLESATDADRGENAVQNYTLNPNDHFRLDVQSHSDGSRSAELVLEKQLDREENAQLFLVLSAIDGGTPKRTGTAKIVIDVLDNNDNVPQFHQSLYKVKLLENSQPGTLVAKVEATDRDLGSNADITYSFGQVPENVLRSFKLNKHTGELIVAGIIDYEEDKSYAMNVKATDGGGLSAYCKVIVEVQDTNDNAPEVTVTSITSPFPEDSPPDTVAALFSVTDQDSGDNGRTSCTTEANLPFMLKTSENNYYQLVIQQPLDREGVSEYNITITATDWGSPRLTSTRIINVQISDVNDNSPVFEKSHYELPIVENNIPGLLMGLVHADDLDTEQNAKITYSLLPGKVSDQPVSSYVSINSETGNLYAIRSLDYEQIKDFRVTVRAVDSGSPPLSSEIMVRVVVVDENDNAPFILYPLQNGSSPSNDLVPREAEAGYLVTKVVAVDRDSGQNSWLTYELLKATEPGLFSVGTQNGEVKTMRPINNRDTFKQKLIIRVRDNGHPPQSTSATLSILLVDGFSDPYMKMLDIPKDEVIEGEDHTLTMYLVICLAVISCIFLVSLLVFVAIKIHKRRKFIGSSALNFPVGPNFPENCGDADAGSLSRAYNYEVCLAGGSLNSEFRFLRPLFPVFSVEPAQNQGDLRISGHHAEDQSSQVRRIDLP
ncbi:UNVERIFIED_CONTAM: hypothetical protein K2H54_016327 [Gekko kuhli]